MKNIIYFLSTIVFSVNATTLDEQYAKLFSCETDTYIDQLTGSVHGAYFEERKLKPCKINNDVASFCVKDRFIGLPVSRVDIPNTYSIVLLNIDKNIKYVSEYIKENKHVSLGKKQSFSHPYLMKDPENKNKTFIICELEP